MTDPLPIPDDEADLGEIVVIGRRPVPGSPKNNPPPEEQVELDPFPEPTPPDGAVWTQEEADAEAERQKDCSADKVENDLEEKEQFRKDKKEFFSFTWIRGGDTATHPYRGGQGDSISRSEFNNALNEFGINRSDVLGLNHNHPEEIYCNSPDRNTERMQRTANAYPSDNDWAYADELIGSGGLRPHSRCSSLVAMDRHALSHTHPEIDSKTIEHKGVSHQNR